MQTARAWGTTLLTDMFGPVTQVREEAADLATCMGRLVFADPQWTPARARSRLRAPDALAANPGEIAHVAAAVQHAAVTLQRLAVADAEQVWVIASAGRLYVPTRSRTAHSAEDVREHVVGLTNFGGLTSAQIADRARISRWSVDRIMRGLAGPAPGTCDSTASRLFTVSAGRRS